MQVKAQVSEALSFGVSLTMPEGPFRAAFC